MKLIKLKIINFGQFSNFTFDLLNPDVNVFYGANEAGKSTIVAFIKQILFGFHLASHNSPFFENYTPLAQVSPMGGYLLFENEKGQRYELERLYAHGKGSKLGTLTVKCDNQVVPENVFFDQIKNIDGNFYADSFIFNQDMLTKVDQIKQKDLLERIYYLGAADSDKLITVRDDFTKNADSLFKKKGRKLPVNQLLLQIQEQQTKVSDSENEFSVYKELNSDLKKQEELQHHEEAKRLDLQRKYDNLEKVEKLVPSYEKLQDLQSQIKTIHFDSAQYQSAQNLAIQAETLRKKRQKISEKLTEYSQVKDEDISETKLLQKKSEILQWQAEYHSCLQKETQIKSEQQQLITLDPNLGKIAALTQEQVIKLQEDFQKLPPKETVINQDKSNKPKQFLLLGGTIFILGLILLFIARAFGLLAIGVGIAFAVLGYYQQTQVQKSAKAQAERSRKAKEQQFLFEKQYGIKPSNLDLNNLINEWRQYQVLSQNLKRNQLRKTEISDLLTPFAMQLGQELEQAIDTNFSNVLRALDQLAEKIDRDRKRREEQNSLKNNLTENNEELQEVNVKLKMILARAQVSSLDEYREIQKQKLRQDNIKNQINALKSSLQSDLIQLQEYVQDKSSGHKKLQDLAAQISLLNENINLLQSKTAETKVKMENLASSTAVFEEKQKLANLRTRLRNLSAEYLTNLFTAKLISRALDLASNERFPKMLITAKEYLRLLTNNRYNNIEIGKKITVTRFDGKKLAVEYLSRGTSEQLYFALKLAFVEQIKDQINLPILIDDSFVNFDDQRINEIEKLLQTIAQSNQVLIFTAQKSLVAKLQLQPLTFKKGIEHV